MRSTGAGFEDAGHDLQDHGAVNEDAGAGFEGAGDGFEEHRDALKDGGVAVSYDEAVITVQGPAVAVTISNR